MYNEKIDEIIYLLKNNSISDFIASLSLIVAIIAVIVTIIINVRENKKYINSLKPLLSFSLYKMNGLLLLLVKNNGQSEAKNIRIKVLELKNNGSNSKLMYIDGKYQSKISNWGLSQYSWNAKLGFDYEFLGEDSLKHNLNNMKNKLEGYLQNYRLLPIASSSSPAIKFINNNTNNNEICRSGFQKAPSIRVLFHL